MKMTTKLATAVVLVGAAQASGAFVVPDGNNYAWTRGQTAGSTYAQWEVFGSTSGPNAPDVGQFVGGVVAGSFNAFDRGNQSFVTGSGNIYSINGFVRPQVDIPNFGFGSGYVTTVLVQTRTFGFEIAPASVLVNGVGAVGSTELFRQALGGPGGNLVDTLWRFELAGNAALYTLTFEAGATSMSLDRVAIDTYTVVPGVGVLPAAGGLVLLRSRRRR
jgi:hypothetical protein